MGEKPPEEADPAGIKWNSCTAFLSEYVNMCQYIIIIYVQTLDDWMMIILVYLFPGNSLVES